MRLEPWEGKVKDLGGLAIFARLEDLGIDRGASARLWIKGYKKRFSCAFVITPEDITSEDETVKVVNERIGDACITLIADWLEAGMP